MKAQFDNTTTDSTDCVHKIFSVNLKRRRVIPTADRDCTCIDALLNIVYTFINRKSKLTTTIKTFKVSVSPIISPF